MPPAPAVKSLFLLAAITALALAPSPAHCAGEAEKTITVTGITDRAGRAVLFLFNSFEDLNNFSAAARGAAEISGGKAVFALYRDERMTIRWNGEGGLFFIVICAGAPDNWAKIYTNGETGETAFAANPDNYRAAIVYDNTTLAFGGFGINFDGDYLPNTEPPSGRLRAQSID